MALYVYDGWDQYNSASADMLNRSGRLVWTTQFDGSFVLGRNGFGKAFYTFGGGDAGSLQGVLLSTFETFFTGFALNLSSGGTAVFQAGDATVGGGSITQQFSAYFYAVTGQIAVYKGSSSSGTLLGTTANGVFVAGGYNYIEIGATINASTGSVVVRLNGAAVLTLSNVDNQVSANAYISAIGFSIPSVTSNLQLDDWYFCDNTTGPGSNPCDTFLGDCTVDTGFAVANAAVQFTPLANANWQEISETAMDSDTSYNYSNTAGQTDLFTFSALRTAATSVLGVQVTSAVRKDDATSHVIENVISSSGTVSNGATLSVPSNYVYDTDLWVLDPATGTSWTVAGVNALEAGYSLVS